MVRFYASHEALSEAERRGWAGLGCIQARPSATQSQIFTHTSEGSAFITDFGVDLISLGALAF